MRTTKKYSIGAGPLRRPIATSQVLHLLVPDVVDHEAIVRSKDEQLTHNSEKEDYINELRSLAKELQFEPIIHRLILSNIKTVIDTIPKDELVMNLCDGCDIDGVPGPSVAAYLEGSAYQNIVGCDSHFITNTLTKNGMKLLFQEHHVSSPPGFGATKETDIEAEVERWGMIYPLFVKVSDSYGSVGLDDASVCHDPSQLKAKCDLLFKEFPHLTIEEFIDGPEFSVLVSGNCRESETSVIVYPPAERSFQKSLAPFQRFVSFERNWDEAALAHDYIVVPDANDYNALQDLARRAYTAVSGNAYGRVDIRKRDINGKFYVLEVNASCGLGKGSSSEFILKLANQTTKDFFEILLGTALKGGLESNILADSDFFPEEPESMFEAGIILPVEAECRIAQMIKNPSLAILPTPVIHVIVAGVLIDTESGIADPEGKLAYAWGKDAEYISELETIFRNIGYDPILHQYHVDCVEEVLSNLSIQEDVVVNACLGEDGLAVALLIQQAGFKHTVGLNPRFFEDSRDRNTMRSLLQQSRLRVPRAFIVTQSQTDEEIDDLLIRNDISFPIYVKPVKARSQPHGMHSGRKILDHQQLKSSLKTLQSDEQALVEEFVIGYEYRVLVAGNARDPNADAIVFPPVRLVFDDINLESSSIFKKQLESTKALTTNMRYVPMQKNELMLQMDIQDLARRAYVAVNGSCYGIVSIMDNRPPQDSIFDVPLMPSYYGGNELFVVGVSGDVRFGENAKAGIVLNLCEQNAESLFAWLLRRPVGA